MPLTSKTKGGVMEAKNVGCQTLKKKISPAPIIERPAMDGILRVAVFLPIKKYDETVKNLA